MCAAALALVGCKSKSNDANKTATGSGSATAKPAEPAAVKPPTGPVPVMQWTDPEGDLLVASKADGTLEGPCGLTGTITPTDVQLGAGTKEPWSVIRRDGRTFSMAKLDWVIEVSPTGEVVHAQGGTKTPLGKVTGAESDEALQWFGGFVIAAPMIQHKLELESLDGKTKLALSGAADLKSWEVRAGADRVAIRRRDDPKPVFTNKPAFDPSKLEVTMSSPGTYVVQVTRDDDATKAAFPGDKLAVVEDDKGTLSWQTADGGKLQPLAKIMGRTKCRAHDQAVGALVWTYLGTDAGAAQLKTPDKK